MSEPGVILGIYQDHNQAVQALGQLRRERLGCAALIRRTPDDRIALNDDYVSSPRGACIGASTGMVFAAAFMLPFFQCFLSILSGLLTGWMIARLMKCGVDPGTLARYSRWVAPGESMVIVETPAEDTRAVVSLLRRGGANQATVFTLEPVWTSPPSGMSASKEILGGEHLKDHARRLAAEQVISPDGGTRQQSLLLQLSRGRRTIERVCRNITQTVQAEQRLTAGAEWFLDNAYLILGQINEVLGNLPAGYYASLPVLAEGPLAGYPRVHHIADELATHADSRITEDNIADFLEAYQSVTPLLIGELWAVPLMLRLALLENLRRLSLIIHSRQRDQEYADLWANRLVNASRRDPGRLLSLLAELAHEMPNPSSYFAVRLIGHMHDEADAFVPLRGWLERTHDAPVSDLVQREQVRQTADQVSIGNAIGSLRFLARLDWEDLFERINPADAILREDPAAVYGGMDFATRDQYRHVIEEIARSARLPEVTVAREAVKLSLSWQADTDRSHVGYFLLGDGRTDLEKAVRARPGASTRILRWLRLHATRAYFSAIAILAIAVLITLALAARRYTSGAGLIGFLMLAFLPAAELSIQIINYLATRILPVHALPKMDFSHGIPDHCRTLVAVPMMLLTPDTIRGEADRLAVRYLANPERHLVYALLSDFADAPAPVMPEDEHLLSVAVEGIKNLNEQYGRDRFFLLHRERSWSDCEKRWIGWERKRGKLEALNALVTGGQTDAQNRIQVLVGQAEHLAGARYIITLDADTQLPRGTARRLVETISHPLNRIRFNQDTLQVESGYGIIQPRVSTSLPSATASRFARVFSDPTGTDPYERLVADLYQDLTGAGTFYGKGIYDPWAFHRILGGRLPRATILSHDLLEGAYVRTGFVSEIELFDFFPSNYQAYARRQYRWIRGDWQIAPWILSAVPAADGLRERNPLGFLERWKILDNLRRSLNPVDLILLLLLGWLAWKIPLVVSVFAGLVLFLPTLTHLFTRLTSGTRGKALARRDLGSILARNLYALILLPHQAMLSLDAMVRVFYRRSISRRRLLEWETAQMAQWRSHAGNGGDRGFSLQIGTVSLAAALTGFFIAHTQSSVFWSAAPYLGLWFLSPWAVWWLKGRPRPRRTRPLEERDQALLRRLARMTWRYFDDFVSEQTNWLPPDNYQEALNVELAPRTSPTNIGLWLLSTLAAWDFGYLTIDGLLERILATLKSIGCLELFEGHLLNWYDLQTLEPLRPRYVSTVDSGNLLACLWALQQGLQETAQMPLFTASALQGAHDNLCILHEQLRPGNPGPEPQAEYQHLADMLREPIQRLDLLLERLQAATSAAEAFCTRVKGANASNPEGNQDCSYWADRLLADLRSWEKHRKLYFSWIAILASPPEGCLELADTLFLSSREHHLAEVPSLTELADGLSSLAEPLRELKTHIELPAPLHDWANLLLAHIADSSSAARHAMDRIGAAMAAVDGLNAGMSMRFLYDPDRRLFSIGYDVHERRLDSSFYDLLASEARLASFVAIAGGEVPKEHWAALSRPFGEGQDHPVLYSWNGTMFEYLMPLLLHRSFPNSLLDQACKMAVAAQIDYAKSRGIPWGISEAAFSTLDTHQTYQYRAFGVPGLGLKRGLESDLVVSSYSTALALAIDPGAAVANFKRLAELGLLGGFGFYESIDFARQRRPEGENGVIIYAYMAHHQGMSLVALDNALHQGTMQARFHRDHRVRATESLLFERIPSDPPVTELPGGRGPSPRLAPITGTSAKQAVFTPQTPMPKTLFLSNGNYHLMISNTGAGYSRWHELDLTRWRADTTRDHWGSFYYLRDLDEGLVWSATYQPLAQAGRHCTALFSPDRAEFRRREAGIETVTEVTVSPEDDAEIRRLTLINRSSRRRYLELTSYLELALAPHRSDRVHPAFNKLFIETGPAPGGHALLAWRRPRSPEETPVWTAHLVTPSAPCLEPPQYETDRATFIGRNHSPQNPAALTQPLGNSTGTVLDPIFSLRCRIRIEAGQRLRVAFVTAAAESRDGVLALVEKYRDPAAIDSAFAMAWTHAQLELRHFEVQPEEASTYQELGSLALYPNARLRPAGEHLRRNTLGQSRLWAYGISGDLPIITINIDDAKCLCHIREVIIAHNYLRARGFQADLVILDGEAAGYLQPLHEDLRRLIQANAILTGIDRPGGVFLRSTWQMPEEDLTVLLTAARVSLAASRGSLAHQLSAPAEHVQLPQRLKSIKRLPEEPSAPLPFMELPFFNGLGGFTGDGREYAIYLSPGSRTPAPWVNIMANPEFGALVSESGSGFAWSGNSQSNRLTPWSNDPVADPPSEAIYLRDEDTGVYWTPTPQPIREQDAYRTRHGQGYTVAEHNSHAIEQELTTFVPLDESGGSPVRLQRLRLHNRSSRRRRLTVTVYAEWCLGQDREETSLHLKTKWDRETYALLARNTYHPEYGERVAFAAISPAADSFTADRTDFLGRNGTPEHPTAMERGSLSGRTGLGLDACAALRVEITLDPGKTQEVLYMLGQGANLEEVHRLINRFRDPFLVEDALSATKNWWDRCLGAVQVQTPDLAVDFLLNRWLLYQTLSCRVWGRSAFYQSGGAIGFRDQLQDALALLHATPGIAAEIILRAASRQFVEGDVQHWWHPSAGGGVRTRCSDDLLWLVYATTQYVRTTGDIAILDARRPFLDGRLLGENEQEIYLVPNVSLDDGSLFEHCRRALEKGVTSGPHGLPLIGSGDWNDGLNRVGIHGRGESVWLAWFIIGVLRDFADLCELRGDADLAEDYRLRASELTDAAEEAWDGDWYRRAYFDDGTPLGSRTNEEGRLDSLPQSWAVISGAGREDRAMKALLQAEQQLVRWEEGLALLFAPPFDRTPMDPGYIKGYPPGVRENGGQYTHGALWLAMAYARLGQGDRAAALLRILNPVEHARTPEAVERYKVEPYVVAADVYALQGREGLGGWTWYTGSSGWMYRIWLEEVLGFKRSGDRLRLEPAIQSDWAEFRLTYRYGGTVYEIKVENPDHVCRGVVRIELDGTVLPEKTVNLLDDGITHMVLVRMGETAVGDELPVYDVSSHSS